MKFSLNCYLTGRSNGKCQPEKFYTEVGIKVEDCWIHEITVIEEII